MFWIGLVTGIVTGTIIGITTIALVGSNKDDDK